MKEIRFAINATGKASLFRNNCGFDFDKRIKYGLGVGSADLIGFRHSDGKFIGLEIKTATGRASKEQKAWLDFCKNRGCLVGIARSVPEAMFIVFEI